MTHGPVPGVRRRLPEPPPGLLPLAAAATLDLVFAAGLAHGPGGPEEPWSPWLGMPAIWLSLTLPLLLLVTVVVALTGRSHPSNRTGLHHTQTATVVLAVLGLVLYLSPWGRAGIAAVLES